MPRRRRAAGSVPAQDEALVEGFTDALWLEHGLSANTLTAYRTDLYGFSEWLSAAPDCRCVRRSASICLVIWRRAQGQGPKRAAVRVCCRACDVSIVFWCVKVRWTTIPVPGSTRRSSGRPLPKSLTEAEVETLAGGAGPGDRRRIARPRDAGTVVCIRIAGVGIGRACGSARSTFARAWCV